jgi:hypothetical protein
MAARTIRSRKPIRPRMGWPSAALRDPAAIEAHHGRKQVIGLSI